MLRRSRSQRRPAPREHHRPRAVRARSQPFLRRRASPPAGGKPRDDARAYVDVSVSDFVAAPQGRLSAGRDALGPVDLVRRPPSYQFGPAPTPARSDPSPAPGAGARATPTPSSPNGRERADVTSLTGLQPVSSHVFLISDRAYADRLFSIVTSAAGPDTDMSETSSVVSDHEDDDRRSRHAHPASLSQLDPCRQVDLSIDLHTDAEQALETDQHTSQTDTEQHSQQHVEQQSGQHPNHHTTQHIADHVAHDSEPPSQQHSQHALRATDPQNQTATHIPSDAHFPQPADDDDFPSFQRVDDASFTSTLLSTSSLDSSSVSELHTVESLLSVDSTDGTSRTPSTLALSENEPSVFVAVQSAQSVAHTKKALPNFLQNKVPSPVKYTFRPLHSLPSNTQDRGENNQVARILPKAYPQRMTMHMRQTSAMSDSSNNNPRPTSEPTTPTLNAVKKAVDSIDPRVVLGMAHTPQLAIATVGFFRRKRGSDESSARSRKRDSDESSARTTRESNESNQSTATEYYEDDYTKFIEKKPTSPMSPLRLRHHPYFSKMMSHDSWILKPSRMDCRSNSSVSLSTSDEEYIPMSSLTRPSST